MKSDIKISKNLYRFDRGGASIVYDKHKNDIDISLKNVDGFTEIYDLSDALEEMINYITNEEQQNSKY